MKKYRGDANGSIEPRIFLPLILIYATRRELKPYHIILIPFTLLPDLDKFLGMVGLLPSFYILSHLFLDILDGGPVTLLYPFVRVGVGLSFPASLELGSNPFEFSINNVFPQLVYEVPEPSKSYEILSGFGVASAILFLLIVSFDRLEKNDSREI